MELSAEAQQEFFESNLARYTIPERRSARYIYVDTVKIRAEMEPVEGELLAYYEENRERLKLIAVDDENDDNGVGPIDVSAETVRNGTYEPLSRPVFIYVSTVALERMEVAAFVDYFLTESVGLIREVGYVPLSDSEYGLVRNRVAAGTTGSVFADAAANVTLESLLSLGS